MEYLLKILMPFLLIGYTMKKKLIPEFSRIRVDNKEEKRTHCWYLVFIKFKTPFPLPSLHQFEINCELQKKTERKKL